MKQGPGFFRRMLWVKIGPKTIVALLTTVVLGLVLGACMMTRMPGESYRGDLPPATDHVMAAEVLLKRHVDQLAHQIGERNVANRAAYERAAQYMAGALENLGFDVTRQEYHIDKVKCANVVAERVGSVVPGEIVVIGAHYDSVFGSPGANDNATGVASMLVLAERLPKLKLDRSLRFVAFANEEPPYFQTADMGSWVYAKQCRQQNENVVAMLALETLGCYREESGSQTYPFPMSWFYPSEGNFIAFVSDLGSRELLHRVIAEFRSQAKFPSEGAALPSLIQPAGWSDHWAFWQEGYPAIMVTDTAPFRYPHYHLDTDTPEKIDYQRLARITEGLAPVVQRLCTTEDRKDR